MSELTSTWEPAHFAAYLRQHNEAAADMSDDDLISQAAADYPDTISVDGGRVVARHPAQLPASEFVASIRAANPHAKDLDDDALLAQASEENPGAFSVSDGYVALNDPPAKGAADIVARGIEAARPPAAPLPDVVPAHQQPRTPTLPPPTHGIGLRRKRAPAPAINERHSGEWVEKAKPAPTSLVEAAVNTLPTNEQALEFSDRNLNPQARSIVRGAVGSLAGTASTVGNLLEAPAMVDRGWQWLMSKLGIESADGPFVQAQDAARRSGADIQSTVERDRSAEVGRYGAQPVVNQAVEGGTQMAVDLATKYAAVGKLIEATGGVASPENVMALVGGIDASDKGAIETARSMAGGFVQGKIARVTEPYGKTVNAVAQGVPAGVIEYARTGDVKKAAGEAVLQGAMGAGGARGEKTLGIRPRSKRSATPDAPVEMPAERRNGPQEQTPVPESADTISAQMTAMQEGRRSAVLVTPGSPMPEIPAGTVNGEPRFVVTQTEKGNFIHDPATVTPQTVALLASQNRHGELLGHVESKSETTTVGIVARDPQTGAELQASYVSPQNVDKQKAELLRQFPRAKIEVGGQQLEQRVLEQRTGGGAAPEPLARTLEYEVDGNGNYTLQSKDAQGNVVGRVENVKPEDLETHVRWDLADQVRSGARVPPAGAAAGIKPRKATRGEQISGVVNLPRAVVTSFDLSAAGRQGVVLAIGHPVKAAKAFGAQVKAFADAEYARKVQDTITKGPGSERRRDAGLFLPDWEQTPGQKLTMREEAYMSQYAKKIPGVKQSERAYNVFLNKLRADTFDAIADAHPSATPKDLQALAQFVNLASGRGSLGKLEPLAPALAQAFFSPRFTISRLQVLAQPLTAETKMARTVAAKELGKFFIGSAAILAAAKAAGAEVEIDPRSTDFGKIKIGRTRLDIFGGFQQIARNLTQQITGQAKTEEGEIKDIDRGEYALRFARTKLSPQAGAVVDVSTGEDIKGNSVSAGSVARNLIEPLAFRDIEAAVREDLADGGSGVKGALLGSLGIIGVGVQTYEKKPKLDALHTELRRLRVPSSIKMDEGESAEAYAERVGPAGVAVGRAVTPLLDSDSYKALPDDEAKRDALKHAGNYVKKVAGQLPDDAIDHNAKVLLEQHRLNLVVDRSELSPEAKARVKRSLSARLKYAWFFEDERRKLPDIREVFERRRKGIDEWLRGQLEGK